MGQEPIYHYTTAEGLIGILSDKQLWATDIRVLSDGSELRHGAEIVASMARRIDGLYVPEDAAKQIVDKLAPYHIHVACFSEAEDDLAQWRGYGSSGTGYSIAFTRNTLENSVKEKNKRDPNGEPTALVGVLYEEEDKKPQVRKLLESFFRTDSTSNAETASAMIGFVARAKSHYFKGEGESRIIHWPKSDDVAFRARGGILLPYSRISFSPESICGVIQGPRLDSEMGLEGLRRLLRRYHYDLKHIKTRASHIPFR